MIDPQLLKNNLQIIEINLEKRDIKIDLEGLKNLDEERRALKFESEKLRSEQKKLGKEIAISDEDSSCSAICLILIPVFSSIFSSFQFLNLSESSLTNVSSPE